MGSEDKSPGASALTPTRQPAPTGQAGVLNRWLMNKLFDACGRPAVRLRLWDGNEISNPEQPPVATLHIGNRAALLKLFIHPDLYFGEAYMSGDIEVEGDLVRFLEQAYWGLEQTADGRVLERLAYGISSRRRVNSLSGSRSNIHHHYDIGNDFYALWLDTEAMQYTCAYFTHPAATLEQAQVAKLNHVCRKLRLQPGETVIEAGCGWGGLARHMARRYGVKVKAYNISHEQVRYANAQAKAEGLDDQVEYVEDDYRNISGTYDAFVSVGMLEHVGPEHYRELGDVIDRALKDTGRGLIHTIGRNRSAPMSAWVEKRIFPGARPPSLREMMGIFEHNDFSVLDVENLRLHYAETLRHWLRRYEANLDRAEQMFDGPFIRAWRLYLAGSIATFTSGQMQLFQVLFSRARNNDIPLTRDYIYKETGV